jgi:hypothetical protein
VVYGVLAAQPTIRRKQSTSRSKASVNFTFAKSISISLQGPSQDDLQYLTLNWREIGLIYASTQEPTAVCHEYLGKKEENSLEKKKKSMPFPLSISNAKLSMQICGCRSPGGGESQDMQ